MTMRYRSENGKLARGVRKNFTPEEIQRRRIRMQAVQSERAAKSRAMKRLRILKIAERQALVEESAKLGVFVPVADFE